MEQWDEATRGVKMANPIGKTIFKYAVPALEKFTLKLPKGAEVIRIDAIDGFTWLWAVVDLNVPDEDRTFISVKTGATIESDLNLRYIGFYPIHIQMELGLYVFEVL